MSDLTAVKFVRWPADEQKLRRYREQNIPRLIVVEGPEAPPVCTDMLEDWVRPPISKEDVAARAVTLQARAQSQPTIDINNVLRFRDGRLPLSAGEADLLHPLVEAFQTVVPRDRLVVCLWPDSDQSRRNALDLRILRVRRRLEPLRLVVRTAWGRGYLLDAQPAPGG